MKRKNNNVLKIITIFVCVSIIFIFVINESYKLGINNANAYVTMWGAEDVLSFYGDYLSFLGTLILGAITVFQTKKANDISDRLLHIEENRDRQEETPFVVVCNWMAVPKEKNEIIYSPQMLYVGVDEETNKYICLQLEFVNTSRTYVQLEYSAVHFSNQKLKWKHEYTSTSNTKLHILPHDTAEINFYASEKFWGKFINEKMVMEFILINGLGKRYKETFQLLILEMKKYDEKIFPKTKGWYLLCEITHYQIGKILDDNSTVQWEEL